MSVISNTFDLNNIKNELFREANFKIYIFFQNFIFGIQVDNYVVNGFTSKD